MLDTLSARHIKYLIYCFSIPVLFFFSTYSLGNQTPPNTTDKISLQLNGQPMSEVANQISKQINYKVLMSDELAKIKVSGNFTNISLEKFFSRNIFQKKNIVVMYDDRHRTVTIRNFGSKQKMRAYNATTIGAHHASIGKDIDPGTEIFPGVKLGEMEMPEDSADDTTIEATPGHTIANIPTTDEDEDHRDIEITPGNKQSDMPAIEESAPGDIEITPEHTVAESTFVDTTNPQDIEITPGVKLNEQRQEDQGVN